MKRRGLIIVLLLVTVLAGCELFIGTFTANINGTAWEANVFGAVKNGSQYNITASNGNEALVITIPGTTVGTYNINPADTSLDALLYTPNINTPSNYYLSSQGVVDLTKVSSGKLTGTFNVWARNSVTSTDSIQITGQFSNILSN